MHEPKSHCLAEATVKELVWLNGRARGSNVLLPWQRSQRANKQQRLHVQAFSCSKKAPGKVLNPSLGEKPSGSHLEAREDEIGASGACNLQLALASEGGGSTAVVMREEWERWSRRTYGRCPNPPKKRPTSSDEGGAGQNEGKRRGGGDGKDEAASVNNRARLADLRAARECQSTATDAQN
ncbi:hypothetical protein CPB84DRAFT_1826118 [Gymnopilus junonius]|uniref:Uncharacterized protein n=1 Tax=Gymnopilus junonius TaxID=109634 RepID=A0A9P5TLF6_GYMJU|nr:hypothetical protein CPB84DRAFT_1826118 [Gymnopilus junonius]